jgi:uncharacterized membrane protein
MKIQYTIFDIILNILCIVMILGMSIYLFINWGNIPEQIPMQYNFVGDVTRWSGKGEMLTFHFMSLGIFILLSVIERFPKIWNTGVRITVENMGRIYPILKNMLVRMKFMMVAVFTGITAFQSSDTRIPGWTATVIIILFLGVIAWYIAALIRNR